MVNKYLWTNEEAPASVSLGLAILTLNLKKKKKKAKSLAWLFLKGSQNAKDIHFRKSQNFDSSGF